MGIRFDTDGIPSKAMILDQAAGLGIEFEPESMAEMYFLDLCRTLWRHGYASGVSELGEALRNKTEPQPT